MSSLAMLGDPPCAWNGEPVYGPPVLVESFFSRFIDYEGVWKLPEPQDVVSRLGALSPPEPPMPFPADNVEHAMIVIDSTMGCGLQVFHEGEFVDVPVLTLPERINYYFPGNLDEVLLNEPYRQHLHTRHSTHGSEARAASSHRESKRASRIRSLRQR